MRQTGERMNTIEERNAPLSGRRTGSLLHLLVARPIALVLVLLMAAGSVFLWIGIPVGWIWVASHMVKTSQPSLGPYVLVIFAIPVSMWIMGRFLFRLNHLYSRLTGQNYETRVQLPWHRSMRGERKVRRQTT